MPGTTSTALPSFSHDQHHKTDMAKRKRVGVVQWAEMRMIRWMCGVKLSKELSCAELRRQLGIEDTDNMVQQNRL